MGNQGVSARELALSRTVLLIDYEPRSIERVRRTLADAGCFVRIARDGLAGIHAFEELTPDLVIIQDLLPKKHGYEVCHDIKSSVQGESVPVLLFTGRTQGKAHELRSTGCDDYLQKPWTEQTLVEKVRALLPDLEAPATPPQAEPARVAVPSNGSSRSAPHRTDVAPLRPVAPVVIPTRFSEDHLSAHLDDLFGSALDAGSEPTVHDAASTAPATVVAAGGNGSGAIETAAGSEPEPVPKPKRKRSRKKAPSRKKKSARKAREGDGDGGTARPSKRRSKRRTRKASKRRPASSSD